MELKDLKQNAQKNPYTYLVSVIAITLLVVIVAVAFVLIPCIKKVSTLSTELKSVQQEKTFLTKRKASLEALNNDKEDYLKQSEIVLNALPENKEVGKLFVQVDQIATSSNSTIENFSENALATEVTKNVLPGVTKISYTSDVKIGDYFSFKEFLTKFEGALRLVTIDGVSITSDDTGSIKATLTVSTFVRSN